MFRKAKGNDSSTPVSRPEDFQPTNAAEYVNRGWAFYAKKEFSRAEADFRQALETTPDELDSLYALGLSLKVQGKGEEAVKTFQKVLSILGSSPASIKVTMLRTLTQGHINDISHGNWDLEKQIWQNKP